MATLLKDSKWFTENAIDADFIVQNEQLSPLGTRHTPISSAAILKSFRDKATSLGLELTDEKGALRRDGRRFNYVATIINPDDPEFAMECGFTNYNDRSRSFRALYGTHCFICANGCLHGVIEDSVARHTASNASAIQGKVDLVFDNLTANMDAINKQLKILRNTPLTTALEHTFFKNLYDNKVMSYKNIFDTIAVMEEVQSPTLNKKTDDTALRLLNAGTYITTHKLQNIEVKQEMSKKFLDVLMDTVNNIDKVIPVTIPVTA